MAKTKEELCLEVIQRGDLVLTEEGHILRVRRRPANGKLHTYPQPRRIDRRYGDDYARVGFTAGGKRRIAYVHRVVWWFHKGPIPEGLEINHKDGDKGNNLLDNLELRTHAENISHAHRVLKRKIVDRGEAHHHAKLTREKVREMRRVRSEEKPRPTYKQLGRRYGVSGVAARAACIGKTWRE